MSSPNGSFVKRFLTFFFIAVLVMGGSTLISIFGPAYYTYTDEDWADFSYTPDYNQTDYNIVFDQHSHTLYSDGKLTTEQNILWHIAMGYNAMVLTDHNNFDGSEEIRTLARTKYNDSIKVLIGTEWTTHRIHMNFIFPPNVTEYDSDYTSLVPPSNDPTDAEIQDAINAVHALGGVVTVNHIPWSLPRMPTHPSRQELFDWGVDNIEVVNEWVYDTESVEFCENTGMGQITGTDMHSPGAVYSWTLMNTEFTEEAIFQSIKNRNMTVLFEKEGSTYNVEHSENIAYTILKPFIQLGNIYRGWETDTSSIIAWISYLFVAFLITELVHKKKSQ